ncbi:hypothetical protein RND71_043271 [Anisodus tanguticus]|uniref:NFACT protein C-terminal domain-containing protein n=1 Tax=Anisodus tanguticus TaxID=243964 RepID=A0AAE1QPN0_9SOLA|nr:hypothetical protein RND71_043271 [Anisodus tanguticus]
MDLEEHIQNLKVEFQKNDLSDNDHSEKDDKEKTVDSKENGVNYEEIVNSNINDIEEENLIEDEGDNLQSKTEETLKKEDSSSSEEEKIDIADEEYEEDEKNEAGENKESEYLKIVNSLTGAPLPQDILLYAIPVVAPYSALQNVKKAKLVPDSKIKRGRCAKAVIEYFLRDKTISAREKDLIKAIQKDQDLARNLPNKVKLVATNLHNNIKRKK